MTGSQAQLQTATAGRRRRGGGSAARKACRPACGLPKAAAVITRKIPTYELLDEEALVRLEDHADWILRGIGIEFRKGRLVLAFK